MAKKTPEKKYLVPVDFSKSSVSALRYAANLARTAKGSLLVFHVITEPAAQVPFYLRENFYEDLEKSARKKIAALLKRKSIPPVKSTVAVVRAADAAEAIARQAKRSRVAMIVMGSRGRGPLKKLIVGSVAEKTVGTVACPVLIVK